MWTFFSVDRLITECKRTSQCKDILGKASRTSPLTISSVLIMSWKRGGSALPKLMKISWQRDTPHYLYCRAKMKGISYYINQLKKRGGRGFSTCRSCGTLKMIHRPWREEVRPGRNRGGRFPSSKEQREEHLLQDIFSQHTSKSIHFTLTIIQSSR